MKNFQSESALGERGRQRLVERLDVPGGRARIDRRESLLRAAQNFARRRLRPHHHGQRVGGKLFEREVHDRRCARIEPELAHVAADADHRPPARVAGQPQPLPQGAVRPVLPREGLVDHRRRHLAFGVGLLERAPARNRNAHRLEPARRDDTDLFVGRLRPRGHGPAVDLERLVVGHSAERGVIDAAGCHRAGKLAQPLKNGAEDLLACARRPDRHGHRALRMKARIDVHHLAEAAEEQRCARDQDQRERHVGGDQRLPQAPGARRGRRIPAAQRFVEVDLRRGQGREQAEEDAAHQRGAEREGEHRAVDAHLLRARQIARSGREQQIDSPECEQHAQRAAEQGEEEALDQHLPHQPRPAGAQRRAHRQLALPRGRARQDEVSHVGAGHQENQHHRAEEHPERQPHAADHLIEQRHDDHLVARVGRIDGGPGIAHAGRDHRQLRAEIGERGAGREPADHPQEMRRAGLRRELIGRERKRPPGVEILR